MSSTLERLSPWLFTIAMFVLWELVCRIFKIDTFVLPAPSQIFQAIGQLLMHFDGWFRRRRYFGFGIA